ncbi:cilia- and flagella-associated protein 91-like isoform X1 [Limulus polyphemus]|uniref:Cilia- and flagella-associated protein 91 n=2 Tax=Limulus polyphemus TaxID=6850 RepID=A0ABM1TA88_LIMPO|nr:cilia- and flagella-associated protein 91-like isoform X1 [Limulus polyphemus]
MILSFYFQIVFLITIMSENKTTETTVGKTKNFIQESRVHDYIYDPLYTVSSQRDHVKASEKAFSAQMSVKPLVNFGTMFSELSHYPPYQGHVKVESSVPLPVTKEFKGSKGNSQEQKSFLSCDASAVGGNERHLYFHRPILPFLQPVPADIHLTEDHPSILKLLCEEKETQKSQKDTSHHSFSTQTDYREGETQTDPWTPDFIVKPGINSEILTLATLSYGCGLPAGKTEVEMIERARKKRHLEASLPPLTSNKEQWEKRQRILAEIEFSEWSFRENKIERLQQKRQKLLEKTIIDKNSKSKKENEDRLQSLWNKKQEEKNKTVRRLEAKHTREVQRLDRLHEKEMDYSSNTGVIEKFADYGSEVYAPIPRQGILRNTLEGFKRIEKNKYLTTYKGLKGLESWLRGTGKVDTNPCTPQFKRGSSKSARYNRLLTQIQKDIEREKASKCRSATPLRFLKKVKKPEPSPQPPTVVPVTWEELEREKAAVILQRFIRGRAVQNQIFEGKERCKDVIKELRSTQVTCQTEEAMEQEQKLIAIALQNQRKNQKEQEAIVDEMLSELEGKTVGSLLDFLSKELLRLQDERKIQAAVIMAERERRMQEAQEAGQRQVEEWRRQQEDEIFKQLVKINEDTIDTYLENIIMDSAIATAEDEAQKEAQHLIEKLSHVATEAEERYSYTKRKEMIAELVHCFLFPEVNKKAIKKRGDFQQERYHHVVHNILYDTTEPLVSETKLIDTSQNTEKISSISKCLKAVSLSPVDVSHKNVCDPTEHHHHGKDKNISKLKNSMEQLADHLKGENIIELLDDHGQDEDTMEQLADHLKGEHIIKLLDDHGQDEDTTEQHVDYRQDENIIEQLDHLKGENIIELLDDHGQDEDTTEQHVDYRQDENTMEQLDDHLKGENIIELLDDHGQDEDTTEQHVDYRQDENIMEQLDDHLKGENIIELLDDHGKDEDTTEQHVDYRQDENIMEQLDDHGQDEDTIEQVADHLKGENIIELLDDHGQDENTKEQLSDHGQDKNTVE